jgi:hypothetical protein
MNVERYCISRNLKCLAKADSDKLVGSALAWRRATSGIAGSSSCRAEHGTLAPMHVPFADWAVHCIPPPRRSLTAYRWTSRTTAQTPRLGIHGTGPNAVRYPSSMLPGEGRGVNGEWACFWEVGGRLGLHEGTYHSHWCEVSAVGSVLQLYMHLFSGCDAASCCPVSPHNSLDWCVRVQPKFVHVILRTRMCT